MVDAPSSGQPDPTLLSFYKEIKRLSFPRGMWFVNVDRERAAITITSFVVAPYISDVSYTILVNGMALEKSPLHDDREAQHLIDRLEMGTFLNYPASVLRFDADVLYREADVRISLEFGINSVYPVAYHLRDFSEFALPDRASMMRVCNNDNELTFNFLGYSQVRQILDVVGSYIQIPTTERQDTFGAWLDVQRLGPGARPRRVPQDLKILDWGVGCGRCSRFMEHFLGPQAVFGVDIDPITMPWVQRTATLPEHYQLVDSDQALPFESDFFDVIYGVSVMTHLSEARQMHWLEELHRVIKPGGIAVLTTHGFPAFFCSINNGNVLAEWLRTGFYINGANRILDEGFPESARPDSYLNVFHTPSYIYSRWGTRFDIMEVLPGVGIGRQDLVVLRRPSSG